MKYLSVFATILLIWLAIILMAITVGGTNDVFALYLAAMASTIALFLIGFSRK